ncbi:MAG: hypothetical protein H0S79_25850 [Anaerolineaceae bacterium]|nr:hypothetical protein [Anaerolineaceae bacterium]
MKKKVFLAALVLLLISLSLSACKKSSGNEAAAFVLDRFDNYGTGYTYQISDVMDLSDRYDDADETWCVGVDSTNDETHLVLAKKVDGEWDMHIFLAGPKGSTSCADRY